MGRISALLSRKTPAAISAALVFPKEAPTNRASHYLCMPSIAQPKSRISSSIWSQVNRLSRQTCVGQLKSKSPRTEVERQQGLSVCQISRAPRYFDLTKRREWALI